MADTILTDSTLAMVALPRDSKQWRFSEEIVTDVPQHVSEVEVNTIWGYPNSIDPETVIMMEESEVGLQLESDAKTRKSVACKERVVSKKGRLLANSWCPESWSEVIDQFYAVPNYDEIICKPENPKTVVAEKTEKKCEKTEKRCEKTEKKCEKSEKKCEKSSSTKPSRYSEQQNRCPRCSQTFLTTSVLQLHLTECQIAFTEDSSEFSPSSHVSLKRSRSSSPSSSTCRVSRPVEDTLTTYDDLGLRDEDGTYHCLFCTKVFITMNEMRAHCKEDHNSKAFKCKICEGLFSNPRSLLMHTYTHTGEKPFKCTYCPLSFRQLSHRTGHIKKIHADDSPYPCEECSDRFASQNELNKHKKVSHVKRSDQNCHHCGKRYPTPGQAKSHMVKCKSRARSVKCGACQESFYTLRDLQTHSNFCRTPQRLRWFGAGRSHCAINFQCNPFPFEQNISRAGDGITDSVCRDCNETFPTLSKFSLHAYLCREKRKIKEEESVEESLDTTVESIDEEAEPMTAPLLDPITASLATPMTDPLVVSPDEMEKETCEKCGVVLELLQYKQHILVCVPDTDTNITLDSILPDALSDTNLTPEIGPEPISTAHPKPDIIPDTTTPSPKPNSKPDSKPSPKATSTCSYCNRVFKTPGNMKKHQYHCPVMNSQNFPRT